MNEKPYGEAYRHLMLLNHLTYQKKIFDSLTAEGLPLSTGQPKIFDFLLYGDGCMQKEIAAGCCIEPASVTSLLTTMEQRGYIERRRKDGNRRSFYVYLTPTGIVAAQKVRKIMERLEDEALSGLTRTERVTLLRLMTKVNETLTASVSKE